MTKNYNYGIILPLKDLLKKSSGADQYLNEYLKNLKFLIQLFLLIN